MEKKFVTDEDIINKYYHIYNELGATQKCCDAILELSHNQSEPWKSILEGLVHTIKGDGIGITSQRYEGKEEYEKAYIIFEEAKKQIKNKKGLLFLFVEKQRIDALALCFEKPVKEIEPLFDNLINKFKDDKTPAIQAQVAKAMLSKSFTLWKYAKLAESEDYKDEQKNLFIKSTEEADKVINIFDTQEYIDNNDIQITIAKTLRNQANDINSKSNEYKKESIAKQRKVIEKYEKCNDNGLQKQVASAMFSVAFDLHIEKIAEDAKIKNAMSFSARKITSKQVIDEYNKLIKKYKNSTVFDIQQNVLFSMMQKISLYESDEESYKDDGKGNKLMASYSDIIQYYKNHESVFSEFSPSIDMIKTKKTGLKKRLEIESAQKKKYEEQNNINEQINKLIEFYPDNKKHLKQLIGLIRKGQIIPYIGAGLSHFKINGKPVYPLWGEFLDEVYEKYRQFGDKIDNGINRTRLVDAQPPFKDRSCIDKASFLKEQLGQGFFGIEVIDTFRQKKYSEIANFLEKQPYTLLPELFTNRFVLTTNFDNLIELIYQEKEKPFNACSVSDIDKMDEIDSNRTILYKLHGTIDQPNSIILTREDYSEHYKSDSPNSRILSKYLSGNSVLFMGCSLDEDDDIMPFYKKRINYAVFSCAKDKIEEAEQKLSKKNIIPILFPKNEFHYIFSILKYCLFEIDDKNDNDQYMRNLFEQALKKMGKSEVRGFLEYLVNKESPYELNTNNNEEHSEKKENKPPKFSDIEL